MEAYPANVPVTVHPFTYRVDEDEAIIVNSAGSSFLAIPASALDILNDLAAGRTVAEAAAAYARKHGETPDLQDFLQSLRDEGFVSLGGDAPVPSPDSTGPGGGRGVPRYHFESISEPVARRVFSRPVLLACALLMAWAGVAVASDPVLLPSPEAMVFPDHLAALTLAVFGFILATIFLHELAHLVAARAAGAPARLALNNRLWYLVAETDMTRVWLAPRRRRYLAFLAGPLLDATSAAILILALWTDHRWPWLPSPDALLLRAFVFTYLVRLLWQGCLFVRTDLYFVLATLFDCKNLMQDTQDWLGNQVARVWHRWPVVDQSRIPPAERRVIRAYAAVWLVGRALAFGVLVLVTLPILWGYVALLPRLLVGGQATTASRLDALTWLGLTLAVEGTGMFLWLRGLVRSGLPFRSFVSPRGRVKDPPRDVGAPIASSLRGVDP